MGFLLVSVAYAQQPSLQIMSPSNQSLAPEGLVVTITLSVDPSVQNIWVVTQAPLPEVQPTDLTDLLYQVECYCNASFDLCP